MSLETLLEAAKYVEYRSEAKARGEVPHDYFTFSKLSAAGKDGFYTQAEQVPQKRQPTISVSSHVSEEGKEKRRPSQPRDSVLSHDHSGPGTREVHNKLEKNRRAHLKECFEALKKQLPNMDDRKTSNLSILRGAIRYIQTLKRKEREYEHDMERLAREKIAFQQRLSILKKDLTAQLDHIDSNNFPIPEEDNETTTTASECGGLSDFDDTLSKETSTANSNLASDLTSSSTSSVSSSLLSESTPTSTPVVSPTTPVAPAKQVSTATQLSVPSKDTAVSPTHYSQDTFIAAPTKNSLPVTAHPAHLVPNSDNCAPQAARVFSTNNLHAVAGIFATPHTMQVISQPSGIKVITAPNTIVASGTTVPQISVTQHHQSQQIHVLAPTSNAAAASYASTVAPPKPFCGDPSVAKALPKSHLVSPLALVSPQAMVGIPQCTGGKPGAGSTISELIASSGVANSLSLSQGAMKANSVLAGNVAIAMKGNVPNSNVVASCGAHSNMIATLQVSKSHSQVIQPPLTSNVITQANAHMNNGNHPGVASNLKPLTANPVRALPHITGVTHVAHVVSQPPPSAPVGQLVAPSNHMTPIVGSVSVVSHSGAVHQQPLGKVLKSVNQIPIIQQQFQLQQVSVASSQPVVKPVVVVSVPSVMPANSVVAMGNEQAGVVRGTVPPNNFLPLIVSCDVKK